MSDHAVEILITNAIHTTFIKYPEVRARRTVRLSGHTSMKRSRNRGGRRMKRISNLVTTTLAKVNPGKLSYGTGGAGGITLRTTGHPDHRRSRPEL